MLERLNEIEQRLFMLDMIDRWKPNDREEYYKLSQERIELIQQKERGE